MKVVFSSPGKAVICTTLTAILVTGFPLTPSLAGAGGAETPQPAEIKPASSSPGTISGPSFPEIPGWTRSPEVASYHPGNLYEYINGAADLFLSFDFQELRTTEYQGKTGTSITVDLYRFPSPRLAFGMYSQEKPALGPFLKIGTHGYLDLPNLNFLAGEYYVKLSSYGLGANAASALESFARHVAAALGNPGPLPRELAIFPPDSKIPESERFSAKNFLGYEFLHSAFTADYQDAGTSFKLFLIEGADASDGEKMLAAIFRVAQKTPGPPQEGRSTVTDPHYGEVALFWKGKFIAGVLSLADAGKRSQYLSFLESRLAGLE